jgi:hypothetical protein
VHIREILQRVKPLDSAKYVLEHSFTGYTTNLPLSALDDIALYNQLASVLIQRHASSIPCFARYLNNSPYFLPASTIP